MGDKVNIDDIIDDIIIKLALYSCRYKDSLIIVDDNETINISELMEKAAKVLSKVRV